MSEDFEFILDAHGATDEVAAVKQAIDQLNAAGYEYVHAVEKMNLESGALQVVVKGLKDGFEQLSIEIKRASAEEELTANVVKHTVDVMKQKLLASREQNALDKETVKASNEMLRVFELKEKAIAREEKAIESLSKKYLKNFEQEQAAQQRRAALFARGSANILQGRLGMGTSQLAAGTSEGLGIESVAGGVGIGVAAAGVAKLGEALKTGIQDAPEFYHQIQLIASAGGQAGGSVDGLANSVLSLSNKFGASRMDVAAGLMEIVSSTTLRGAEATKLLDESMRLSVATGAQLSDTTSLLSGAMQAYGLNVDQAQGLTSLFWKAAAAGGIPISQLSEFIGRTALNSKALGLSVEETLAQLIQLRRHGVSASDAFQILAATENALILPNKTMAAVFNELGVSSGPQAVAAAGGLGGVIEKLKHAVNDNNDELAQMFTRLRNTRGALLETADSAGELQGILKELSASHQEFAKASEASLNTVKTEWDKTGAAVKNFFVWLGEGIDEAVVKSGALKGIQTIFAPGEATRASFQENLDAQTKAYYEGNQREADGLRERIRAFEAYNSQVNAALNESAKEQKTQEELELATKKGIFEQTLKNIRDEANEEVSINKRKLLDKQQDDKEAAKEAEKEKTERVKEAEHTNLEVMRDASERRKEIFKKENEDRAISEKIDTRQASLEKEKFEVGEKRAELHGGPTSPGAKFDEEQDRRQAFATKLMDQEGNLERKGDLKNALANNKERMDLLLKEYSEREALSKKMGGEAAQIQKQELDRLLDQRIQLAEEAVSIEAAMDKQVESRKQAERAAEAADRKRIRSQEDEDRKKNEAAAEDNRKKVRDVAKADRDAKEALDKKDRQETRDDKLKQAQVDKVIQSMFGFKPEDFKSQAEAAKALDASIERVVSETTKIRPESVEQVKAVAQAYENAMLIRVQTLEAARKEKDLVSERFDIEKKLIEQTAKNGPQDLTLLREKVRLQLEFNKAKHGEIFEGGGTVPGDLGKAPSVEAPKAPGERESSFDWAKGLTKEQEQIALQFQSTHGVPPSALGQVSRDPAFASMIDVLMQFGYGPDDATKWARERQKQLAKGIESPPRNDTSDRGQAMIILRDAGYAEGGTVDSVPAMLTPGEYVMPRNRVMQFYPQLEAMRTSQVPANNQSNVVSLGDINVSVGGGETSQLTALEIGRALRREVRRGMLSLKGD